MAIIETYRHEGAGYNPFLIREGWQVAQLNYLPEQGLDGIVKMDRHLLTDEVFILLKGRAVLIAGRDGEMGSGDRDRQEDRGGGFLFEAVRMELGVTYNIPASQWHNIAMGRGAELIIVEKDNTHAGDYEFRPLAAGEQQALYSLIGELLG